MEKIWAEMYQAAKTVQNDRRISDYVEAGGVAAAILSSQGKIYFAAGMNNGFGVILALLFGGK